METSDDLRSTFDSILNRGGGEDVAYAGVGSMRHSPASATQKPGVAMRISPFGWTVLAVVIATIVFMYIKNRTAKHAPDEHMLDVRAGEYHDVDDPLFQPFD